ncbi:MAG: hypothetical protein QXU93_09095 [Thermoproteus sp.]
MEIVEIKRRILRLWGLEEERLREVAKELGLGDPLDIFANVVLTRFRDYLSKYGPLPIYVLATKVARENGLPQVDSEVESAVEEWLVYKGPEERIVLVDTPVGKYAAFSYWPALQKTYYLIERDQSLLARYGLLPYVLYRVFDVAETESDYSALLLYRHVRKLLRDGASPEEIKTAL